MKPERYLHQWQDETVGYIQINRPEKANAYNDDVLAAMERAFDQFEVDDAIRTIAFCGEGRRAFCSGVDLGGMHGKGFRSALNLKSAQLFTKISVSHKVTLAVINGAAVAGGLELTLACDIRIASDNARFFLPEPTLGLIPAAGGTQRLPAIVGVARAKEMILGGQEWDAEAACRYGLVSEIVPFDDLFPRAQRWAEQIAQRDPTALRLAKQAINPGAVHAAGYNLELVSEALLYEIKRDKGMRRKQQ